METRRKSNDIKGEYRRVEEGGKMRGRKERKRVIEEMDLIKVHYMTYWHVTMEPLTMYNLINTNLKNLLKTFFLKSQTDAEAGE